MVHFVTWNTDAVLKWKLVATLWTGCPDQYGFRIKITCLFSFNLLIRYHVSFFWRMIRAHQIGSLDKVKFWIIPTQLLFWQAYDYSVKFGWEEKIIKIKVSQHMFVPPSMTEISKF